MTTGQLIRAARKRAKMTQAELAEKLGISYVGVSQWENGIRNPKHETMQKIADALGISLSELVGMNPAVDIPENRAAFDAAAKMMSDAEISIKDKRIEPDEDRISSFYKQLNTDGMLAASKCFFRHLKPESLKEVADYVEKLAQTPQYQRLQKTDEGKK